MRACSLLLCVPALLAVPTTEQPKSLATQPPPVQAQALLREREHGTLAAATVAAASAADEPLSPPSALSPPSETLPAFSDASGPSPPPPAPSFMDNLQRAVGLKSTDDAAAFSQENKRLQTEVADLQAALQESRAAETEVQWLRSSLAQRHAHEVALEAENARLRAEVQDDVRSAFGRSQEAKAQRASDLGVLSAQLQQLNESQLALAEAASRIGVALAAETAASTDDEHPDGRDLEEFCQTGGLGCWPSLYLLGVQRGGTTALARALSETPGLGVQVGALFDGQALPAPEWELSPRHVKEPHAFDRFFRNGTTNVRSRGHAQCRVRTSVRLQCTVHH